MKFLAILLGVFSAIVSAQAEVTQTTTTLEKTKMASMHASHTTVNGCIETGVYAYAYADSNESTTTLIVSVSGYNLCTDENIVSYFGSSDIAISYATLKSKKSLKLEKLIDGTAYLADDSSFPVSLLVKLDLTKDTKIWNKDKYSTLYRDTCGRGDVRTDNSATGMTGTLEVAINGVEITTTNVSTSMQLTAISSKKVSNCATDSGKG